MTVVEGESTFVDYCLCKHNAEKVSNISSLVLAKSNKLTKRV